MRSILLSLAVVLYMGVQLSAGNPTKEKCCPVVVSSAEVDFSYDEARYSSYFAPAYFNTKTQSMHFESMQKITSINIYDDAGELQFKLPVLSNKVRLSKNMFEKGDYKVEFNIEGVDELLPAYVTIN